MRDVTDGVEVHIEGLRRYAFALVGNMADADDLVQESLRRALSQIENQRKIEDWRAYLYAILHNVFVSQVSRFGARSQISLDDNADRLFCSAPQHAQIEFQDLGRELLKLPADQREVILLVGLEGLSYREVADALDIPLGTVMSRLNRGRAALRRAMSSAPAISGEEVPRSKADMA